MKKNKIREKEFMMMLIIIIIVTSLNPSPVIYCLGALAIFFAYKGATT